jgi:hypothetical protein
MKVRDGDQPAGAMQQGLLPKNTQAPSRTLVAVKNAY